MKKIFYFLICICALSCSKNKTVPEPVPDPLPTTERLDLGWTKITNSIPSQVNDVLFTDILNGVICSNEGLFSSTNGGTNWTRISDLTGYFNIASLNNTYLFLGGTLEPKLWKNNSLSPVTLHYSPNLDRPYAGDAFFSSSNICYISSGIYVWKSTDGGNNFDSVYNFNYPTNRENTIYFQNDVKGWIIRNDSLYKTNDGGFTWSFVLSPQNTSFVPGCLQFLDNNKGYVITGKDLYTTDNGGITFSKIYSFNTDASIDMSFVSASTGFVSTGSRIYKTTNGGINWSSVVELTTNSIIEIHFVDANHGWACGSNGFLLRYAL